VGPTGETSILQVHPTRRCNLRCLHCYSDSGPDAIEELPIEVLRGVVSDAARLGYSVLSVSGGEPLMYSALTELLRYARAEGMRTQVISNGMLANARQLEGLRPYLDLLAFSLDGPPVDHDRMRGRDGAFAALKRNLEGVRASGVPFGFLFTLTMHNVHQLEWAAQFAVQQGAALLQVHPLEATGRGTQLDGSVPDEVEGSYALLEAARIQAALHGSLRVHVDLLPRVALAASPERLLASDAPTPIRPRLADLVTPLVVEPDGACVPLEYGFPRALGLGNVRDESLEVLAERWLRDRYPAFREVCRRAHARASAPGAASVVNWYREVAEAA
jgi:MoaA/NifB/PqqE/SkfB family radical SAM enzyme